MEANKEITIPHDEFRKMMIELDNAEYIDCYEYKHYHESIAHIMNKLRPYLGEVVENPSDLYKEYKKNIRIFMMKHEEEYRELEGDWSDEPHCQICGCDREDGDCDECDNCYADEYEEPETRFMKLPRKIERDFERGKLSEDEMNELQIAWEEVKDNYCINF